MSKLNPSCSAFFQHPKQSVNPEDAVWYENRPLGVNKLGEMMKTISVGVKLSQLYTNHSVRASAITLLSDANVPDRHIMFISSSKARTEWPPTFRCRPQPQVFRVGFLTPVIFWATSRCFSAYRPPPMTKSDLLSCCILNHICTLRCPDFAFDAIVSSRTSDARFKFDFA